MFVERTTRFPCSAEQCFAETKTTRLMLYVARPLVRFLPIEPQKFPQEWQEREYRVSIKLFGVLPVGQQVVRISGRDRSAEMGHFCVELRDDGYGALMSKWDHLITIESLAGDVCRYTDRVEVEAGLLTPFVCLFAWVFYRHRQRRWLKLIQNGFAYD